MSDFLNNFEKKVPRQTEPSKQLPKEPGEIEGEVVDRGNSKPAAPLPQRSHQEEETEFDPRYKKRKQQLYRLIFVLVGVFVTVTGLIYYQVSHVEMPDFKNKPLTDVQQWAAKNKMTFKTEHLFNLEAEKNNVIKQDKAPGKKVKKGSELFFELSQGGDPEEKVTLPDFNKLSFSEAQTWLEKEKVENLTLLSEFDEKIPQDKFSKIEFAGEVTADNFKRGDNGKLYYSKGKEVYQKNIDVPDFNEKEQSDVETWAKQNELVLELKKVPSSEIPKGQVVAQSIKPKEKVAKKTKFVVDISAGKGIIVPNFGELTKETALNQKDLLVTVKEQFNPDVPYGQLLSQSVESGTELTEDDDLGIDVTYSAGKPYIKDLTGELEGELQKIFFDEYRSKGANIYYVVNYVASEEKKGTIVSMDTYNTFVPLDYTVTINVSLGVV